MKINASTSLANAWIDHIALYIKGETCLSEYKDPNSAAAISILTITSDSGKVCASVGLVGSAHQPPVEILIDSLQPEMPLEQLLSTVAFSIQQEQLTIRPGAVCEGLVAKLHPGTALAHLLFVPQFQWDYAMSEAVLPEATIYPLLAIPVSAMELAYLHRIGYGSLEHLWERREINLLDWQRPSAVTQLDIDRALIRKGQRDDH